MTDLQRPITPRRAVEGHTDELPTVDARGWTAADAPAGEPDEELVHLAGRLARRLPPVVDDALLRFVATPAHAGAMLVRGLDVGPLPPTPPTPTAVTGKDLTSELVLLTFARRLGQPVGYEPEHGGRIVQQIVPTRTGAELQVSTSSRATLMFHTETAFHPHRPRYLLLLCLRGDPAAHTTLVSVFDLLDHLPADAVPTLFEPRFRTAVDASFLGGRRNQLGPVQPLVSGTRDEPTLVFDADLTIGTDVEAERALALVRDAVEQLQTSVVLDVGDLLIVDNNIAVHGRSAFRPRFDGTDRWLQRAFVVADLAPSAAERRGRVITTRFGRD